MNMLASIMLHALMYILLRFNMYPTVAKGTRSAFTNILHQRRDTLNGLGIQA